MKGCVFWAELQKRADRADQSVLIFLGGANLWAKHAKNYATMSMSNAHITFIIAHCTTNNVFLTLVLVTHCL